MSLSIIPFSAELQPYFDRFNRDWIVKYFHVEPIDELVLGNPQEHIIDKGGEVWFAELNGTIVGAYGMLARDDGNFEFTKLGISAEAKGQKLGQKLLHHCYERARARGAKKVIIYTSSILKNANDLYRGEGFVDMVISAEDREHYERADVFLERNLVQ